MVRYTSSLKLRTLRYPFPYILVLVWIIQGLCPFFLALYLYLEVAIPSAIIVLSLAICSGGIAGGRYSEYLALCTLKAGTNLCFHWYSSQDRLLSPRVEGLRFFHLKFTTWNVSHALCSVFDLEINSFPRAAPLPQIGGPSGRINQPPLPRNAPP